MATSVLLANLTRGDLVESTHYGWACLTDPAGNCIACHGNCDDLIYPRSALKPLQTVATRRAGLHLTGAQLAISSASHHGTAMHVELVRQILADAGLTAANLQCPVAFPSNTAARIAATEPTRECFNCSGKHAAFLATCVLNGWPTESYLVPGHPLQQRILAVIEDFTGEKVTISTTDGCGAPLHATTVKGLACAIGRFARDEDEAAQAMVDFPAVVGDDGNPDTILLEAGIVAKIGAEGVFVAATREGYGVAVKIADGNLRAAAPVALKLLLNQGLVSQKVFDELFEKLAPKVLGGSEIVGRLELAV